MLIKPFLDAWKRPFDFKGVTSRTDYWNFVLISWLINFAGKLLLDFLEIFTTYDDQGLIDGGIGAIIGVPVSLILVLIGLGSIPVSLSVFVRRIRDTGKHWSWIFVPIYNIYLLFQPSKAQLTSIEEE
tara:strand:- start:359 stop:742 length:384 start_codon:yes stop_codon:yes gene_type:complete